MRYFTPDLLARFRSGDDDVAAAASDEWEEKSEAYAGHLRRVRSQLPESLRELLDNYYLHDARVVFHGMFGVGGNGSLYNIVLQLDTPPQESLSLVYELISAPVVHQYGERPTGNASVEWLYDELEVRPNRVFPFFPRRKTFKHSILLSTGWELQLSFRNLHLSKMPSGRIPLTDTLDHGVHQVEAS